MSRYDSSFREPPWVMGSPKEVMDWMEASHPRKKGRDKEHILFQRGRKSIKLRDNATEHPSI